MNYEKKFNMFYKRKREMIGKGGVGQVFEVEKSNTSPERVVKEPIIKPTEFEKESPRAIKAGFYLTKIMRILLPDHTIDMHTAASDSEVLIMSKEDFTGPHKELAENDIGKKKLSDDDYFRLHDDLINSISESGITEKFYQAGIGLDDIPNNFGKSSKDGNTKYVDTIEAWAVNGHRINMYFKPEKLKTYIAEHLEGDTQKKAMNYYDRLMALLEEDKENIRDTRGVEPVISQYFH